MDDRFRVLTTEGRGDYREKGSKFLAFAFPVSHSDEVDTFIAALKSQHPKARHFCYAYRIDDDEWRANDDGEPRHSAGTPIFRQIQSAELYRTAVVVIRYFGGTKLGVSGLINAYETAAAEALSKAASKTTFPTVIHSYTVSYAIYNRLMQLLSEYDAEIIHQNMAENVDLTLRIRTTQSEMFSNLMDPLLKGSGS
ncbi:MAG: YigZ family protein [Cryomorphaceae bacterium]|nr:YigZ family protein [Cryomorphaceae bacterium]